MFRTDEEGLKKAVRDKLATTYDKTPVPPEEKNRLRRKRRAVKKVADGLADVAESATVLEQQFQQFSVRLAHLKRTFNDLLELENDE